MVSYELQFKKKDVIAAVQKWQKEFAANEERRDAFCNALCHHFNRYLRAPRVRHVCSVAEDMTVNWRTY